MKIAKDDVSFYRELLTKSFSKFSNDDIFTHAAALSYYTIFSLPPMLLIIISTTTWFYDEESVKEALFNQIGELVGNDGAQQLLLTIERLSIFEPTLWATVLGGFVLMFSATSVFITMQNALNRIFKVKPKPATGWGIWKMVKDRILSFTLVIGVSFILLVSLVVNTLLEAFGKYLQELFGSVSVLMTFLTAIFLPFVVITFLFAMIFKFLPDAKLKWKDTWFGAIITSVLFVLGKYLISFYIGNSNVAGLYDAAGSVMVIMVWVFYAAIIVLYGAVFTFTYVKEQGERLPPQDFAVKVEFKEVEKPRMPDINATK